MRRNLLFDLKSLLKSRPHPSGDYKSPPPPRHTLISLEPSRRAGTAAEVDTVNYLYIENSHSQSIHKETRASPNARNSRGRRGAARPRGREDASKSRSRSRRAPRPPSAGPAAARQQRAGERPQQTARRGGRRQHARQLAGGRAARGRAAGRARAAGSARELAVQRVVQLVAGEAAALRVGAREAVQRLQPPGARAPGTLRRPHIIIVVKTN